MSRFGDSMKLKRLLQRKQFEIRYGDYNPFGKLQESIDKLDEKLKGASKTNKTKGVKQ